MATFLATLSAHALDNWDICVRHQMWGTGTSNHAKRSAKVIEAGDNIVVWASTRGVQALVRATGRGVPVTSIAEVPWPEPQRYSFTIPIEVINELDEPIEDVFDGTTSRRFGLKAHYMQAGLYELPSTVAEALLSIFSLPDQAPAPSLAGVYLHRSSSVQDVLLDLYRRAAGDQRDDLLVIGVEGDRAAVATELGQEPFVSMPKPIRFLTAEELAGELETAFRERGPAG